MAVPSRPVATAAPHRPRHPGRSAVAGIVAGALAVALIVGLSIAWPGLDAQETPPRDPSVWVLQSEGLRYARVNTAIGEIDTVRSVANPSRVVESSRGAYMFTDSDSKIVAIDEAAPADLDADGLEGAGLAPAGTVDTVSQGDFVAFRTDAGAVYAGRLSVGTYARIDPHPSPDEDAPAYTSDAVAVDARGTLFSYSAADAAVLRFDIPASAVRGEDAVEADPQSPALTAAGDDWVLVDVAEGTYWTRDEPTARDAGLSGAVVLSRPHQEGAEVYLADDSQLVRVPVGDEGAQRVSGTESALLGQPARPVAHDGEVYAAWLPDGAGPGTLWGPDGERQLDYGGDAIEAAPRPLFVDTGDAFIVTDSRSGWVWTVDDAALIPSSQDWDLDEAVPAAQAPTTEEPPAVIDPRPPVAVADAFGVRPGALVPLPVLLNDHDPNDDVLSIIPDTVEGLDPAFGTVTVTDDRQRLAVRVAADPPPSGVFSYAITDGTGSPEGLDSPPTTVTLTVVPDEVNTAPEWCGVAECRQERAAPQVAHSGTVTISALANWVDPEGDPILLSSVTAPAGAGSATATPSGDIVFQHTEAGAEGDRTVSLDYTVVDGRGAAAADALPVRVLASAQPQIQSFAVVDVAGSRLTVDVADHVTGTAGDVVLTGARVLDDVAATATIVGGTTQFDFAAAEPGTYRVALTVTSSGGEATGTARITLLPADAPADLATSPVVAFVRPQSDSTVDVFAAVSNPTRRVLLLSEVTALPAPGARLSVDAVAQTQLRVSGSTESGEPGILGTVSYRVSDGTNDAGASVEGLATVYLLPPAAETAPIAVDDRIVVRVGSQVDIPVLDNDVAPSGTRPRLDPAAVASSTDDALAFASGDALRYLAPSEPGDYTIEYAAFTTGAPGLVDTATVHVRALAAEANRDPLPARLSGRVISGLTTTIPFDGFGMDPDGDVVRLESIVQQPDVGSAAIAADGTGIVYTSVAGDSGQHTFRYRVADQFGATGEATVSVGVLGGDANPSPVTYTDYVHVQAGADSLVRVSPLANDHDPLGGTLKVTALRPDVPQTALDGSATPEYQLLQSRVRSRTDSTVTIEAGTEPGTMSYLYDVESTSGNTARGLIVVRVVRERVPDYPVVADTVLTVEDRDDFASGIDVLDGKVAWTGGEASSLELGLWGDADGVRVSGARLRGDLDDEARLIPFSVTGESASGPVTTYAFLRIPAEADPTLALRAGTQPLAVEEGGTVDAQLSRLVARPRGTELEVGAVAASGARGAATCARDGATGIRYTAGDGAPWADACVVSVRIPGQTAWTVLSLPVVVTPRAPQPSLTAASLTVAPGDELVYDLSAMTTWQGAPEPISYRVDGVASSFEVGLAGETLTVRAADAAVPGTSEYVTIAVTSHAGVAPARLILRVGSAPSALPRGGTAVGQCSQANGDSCVIGVVGAAGEVNPLPSTPLQVVGVAPTGTCTGITFALASAGEVRATWTSETAGATCTTTFTVRDAQGRQSAAERQGTLLLDLRGFPQPPASVVQSAYADGSLTLRVDPGAARGSYPALTGFELRAGGAVVGTCAPDGTCAAIAAPNGEQRLYEAYAVNALGTSRTAVSTTAWAYDPPAAPQSLASTPVVTAGEGGVVALRIGGVDAGDTGSLEISSPAGETITIAVPVGAREITVPSFRVGANTATPVTVTPRSRFAVPPGIGAGAPVDALVGTANGIGAPVELALALTATSAGSGRADIAAQGSASPGGDGAQLRWGIVPDGQMCTTSPDGQNDVFRGLPDGRLYAFVLCVESWFDGRSYGRSTTRAEVRAVQSTAAPQGWTFVVGPTPHVSGNRAAWTIDQAPTSWEQAPYDNDVVFSGMPSSVFDADPGIQVRYEHRSGWWQSAWGAVTPARGSAPYQVQARWWVDVCAGGASLVPQSSSSGGAATVGFSSRNLTYYDAAGAELDPGSDPWLVPAAAVRVEGIGVDVDWRGTGWNLRSAAATFGAACTPAPTPDPTPTQESE